MATELMTQVQGAISGTQGPQNLDLNNGYVYDMHGNQIGRLGVGDNTDSQLLSAYAHDIDLELSAQTTGILDPDLRRAMTSQMLSARHVGLGAPYSSRAQTLSASPQLLDAGMIGPSDVHIPSAIPNVAMGYQNFPYMADYLMPVVMVNKQTNRFFKFAKEDAFQRAAPIENMGGSVPEITPRLGSDSYSCIGRAIAGFALTETTANQDAPLNIQMAITNRLVSALKNEREIRALGVLRTSSNWATANYIALTSGYQWGNLSGLGGAGENSDPVADLHNIINASAGIITGIGMSGLAYRAFSRNPAVRSYIAYKSNLPGIPSPQEFAATLQLPPFFVIESRVTSSTGALAYTMGPDVVLFRDPPQMPPRTQDDIATAYTLRWDAPVSGEAGAGAGPLSGGFIVRTFFEQQRGALGGQKTVVTHFDAETITSPYIGGLIANALQ